MQLQEIYRRFMCRSDSGAFDSVTLYSGVGDSETGDLGTGDL